MVNRKRCPSCSRGFNYERMYRAYIRKYDWTGKASWVAKGWICDRCDTFVPDEKEK